MNRRSSKHKDTEAVERLFREFYKPLKMYAVRFVYDINAAEDIVQDVFFELWNRKEDINFEGSVKGYLFRATYNKSLNYLNSKSYQTQNSIETFSGNSLEEYCLSIQDTQEDNLIAKEVKSEINSVIQELPPQCRKVFLLSRTHELKNREIAEHLDISQKSVEKHITKALKMIHKHLKDRDVLIITLFLLQLFS